MTGSKSKLLNELHKMLLEDFGAKELPTKATKAYKVDDAYLTVLTEKSGQVSGLLITPADGELEK